ncbi:co-chaperone GroES [Candidatus Kaiserbacteria bacterium CG10_big_fil_rev_8_21_14_0_10_59_10]|uniref:Co-chaperonin GroES n=1 Tax=Candidatus Kaiserbacteria bacterium CG10_big_fil_rev_8_21_14_0_10_59_10 TaxID=1974612 RepID=A0A2H0U7M0_9BACT|nr:MAG: co-chaperone GroES [Candidatus Kaiserbacteria bacterium CG10_big_fil_rev_8_21_14_0_10_59_10]
MKKKETEGKKVKVSPLGDRVLVEPLEADDEKSPAGIIIPDTAQKEKSKRGVVVAVGTGRVTDEGKTIAPAVKPGDKVFFNSGWDNEVEINDTEYFLVRESDILAIIK